MSEVNPKKTRIYKIGCRSSKNAKPKLMDEIFHNSQGMRFSLRVKKPPASTEIISAKFHTATLIHGLFCNDHNNSKYFFHPKRGPEFSGKNLKNNYGRK
jgi:G:T-mismatch repair DNA endonuclease (very short patch repair protein)